MAPCLAPSPSTQQLSMELDFNLSSGRTRVSFMYILRYMHACANLSGGQPEWTHVRRLPSHNFPCAIGSSQSCHTECCRTVKLQLAGAKVYHLWEIQWNTRTIKEILFSRGMRTFISMQRGEFLRQWTHAQEKTHAKKRSKRTLQFWIQLFSKLIMKTAKLWRRAHAHAILHILEKVFYLFVLLAPGIQGNLSHNISWL